jgi:hypothetical protein
VDEVAPLLAPRVVARCLAFASIVITAILIALSMFAKTLPSFDAPDPNARPMEHAPE